jgi:hypothetical protein
MKPEKKKRFKWSSDVIAIFSDAGAMIQILLNVLAVFIAGAMIQVLLLVLARTFPRGNKTHFKFSSNGGVWFFVAGATIQILLFVLTGTMPRSIWFSRCLRLLNFPEETIAELIALKRRRQKQNLPQWKLLLELTTEVFLLLWAIHIQIRLQNLSLPPSKKRNIN